MGFKGAKEKLIEGKNGDSENLERADQKKKHILISGVPKQFITSSFSFSFSFNVKPYTHEDVFRLLAKGSSERISSEP
ncbi:hypothetical protein J7E52_22655 [Bacillus sp. ISL-34]|uniref:hypothetical protein n=1 Tax=Bacillus sp. ISL-34 TaxID=2819121 RepID=UPI001BEBED06|nr:hypothetical protein [Bacillus sp. ISL-34]MBT2649468.1 hypothetical protein [Bacillus sp. ISL-34]